MVALRFPEAALHDAVVIPEAGLAPEAVLHVRILEPAMMTAIIVAGRIIMAASVLMAEIVDLVTGTVDCMTETVILCVIFLLRLGVARRGLPVLHVVARRHPRPFPSRGVRLLAHVVAPLCLVA